MSTATPFSGLGWLDSVINDVVGLSGRRMIDALIRGDTDPQALAALADRRLHAYTSDLEAALRGRVTAHHRFPSLKLHLDHFGALDTAIARIDEQIESNLEPFRKAIELLITIPGVSRLSAEVIASEVGLEMNQHPNWPTTQALGSSQVERDAHQPGLTVQHDFIAITGCVHASDVLNPVRVPSPHQILLGGHFFSGMSRSRCSVADAKVLWKRCS